MRHTMAWEIGRSGKRQSNKMSMKVEILDLGLIEYEQAWKLQDQYAQEIAEGKRPPTL